MNKEILSKIHEVEDLMNLEKNATCSYKQFGRTWIRSDRPFEVLNNEILQYSELRINPNLDLKFWGVSILNIFKRKSDSFPLQDLLGIQFLWKYRKTQLLCCSADVIYDRGSSIILVYATLDSPFVVKLPILDTARHSLEREVKAQKRALKIQQSFIYIPVILKENYGEKLFFVAETYFKGLKQSFNDREKLTIIFARVYNFLLDFYLSNPIELKGLEGNLYLDNSVVEEYIKTQKNGSFIIETYKKLKSKDQKLIQCQIHGDLSHNNILFDGNEICIIDWGKSKFTYVARDLENSSFDTKEVFTQLVERAGIDVDEIYAYDEQIFLEKYIELNRKLYKWLIWKKRKSGLDFWISSQLDACYEFTQKI